MHCYDVQLRQWPNGYYTLAGESNGTAPVFCLNGVASFWPPFQTLGPPIAYYPFNGYVLIRLR